MAIRGTRRSHVVPITAPSFPTLPGPRTYRNIAYTFVALTVVVVVGVLWLSSVRAEITVQAKRTAVQLDGVVEVAKSPQQGQIAGRVVQSVFEKIQEFQVEEPTSTQTEVQTAPAPNEAVLAKGTVRIVNDYSRSQTLVKTTRLLTADNKLYRIDKTITVPAKSELRVGVYADQPGSIYVIGPTRFTIPGLFIDLQKYIYAVSDAPFVGEPTTLVPSKSTSTPAPATTGPKKVVTSAIIEQAQNVLTQTVLEQAKKALAAEVSDPKFTDAVYLVKLIEKKTNVSVGQSADSFLASVKLDVTAVYYPKDDMLILIRSRLKDKIPQGHELLPFENGAVTYTVESADAKAETASVHVSVGGEHRLTAASPSLQKSVVAGKSKSDALTLLRAVEGVQDVRIDLKPSWFSKIPTLQDHIEIKVE